MKKNILLLLVIAVAALAFGAVYAEAKQCPYHKENVIIVKAQVNKIFSIELPSNPTTGYKWDLCKPVDGKYLKFINSKYDADKYKNAVGSGGVEIWTFKALSAGSAYINFKYARPWEKGAAPAKVMNYKVKIVK